MKITNEFVVRIPIDRAWQVLTDLEGIAPCMPGARLTGVEGDVYQGKVKVKVGPVISDFSGTARFTEKDDVAYRAVIDAKGRDARSAGNAAAVVSASLSPEGDDSTKVSVDTDLKISGKLAQFGSGMIKEVSSKLLAQFVANLEAKLAAGEPGPDTVSAAAAETAPATAAALGDPAPDVPRIDETAAAPVAPDPSAGEVEPAAGRIRTAAGTPEPVAPLRTPEPGLAVPAASAASASEPEPLDLLQVAGGSVYKRLVPVAVGVAVVAAVVIWFVARG
ncbi:SRPBCC family protein [Actinoplanes sp. NPDC049802]|uniref:SRPBCC family protein n=1 Tax=Actinoplanes sp. NPDC049802 TaxID=3154742 RepID=UPI0033C834DB